MVEHSVGLLAVQCSQGGGYSTHLVNLHHPETKHHFPLLPWLLLMAGSPCIPCPSNKGEHHPTPKAYPQLFEPRVVGTLLPHLESPCHSEDVIPTIGSSLLGLIRFPEITLGARVLLMQHILTSIVWRLRDHAVSKAHIQGIPVG